MEESNVIIYIMSERRLSGMGSTIFLGKQNKKIPGENKIYHGVQIN